MINRLLSIIYILISKGTVTASELAERFEVSTRTIYRDVEDGRCKTLEEAKEAEGQYLATLDRWK